MQNPSTLIGTAERDTAQTEKSPDDVGQGLPAMEQQIRHIDQLREMALSRYERTGNPDHRAEAERYEREMRALERARPALAARHATQGN